MSRMEELKEIKPALKEVVPLSKDQGRDRLGSPQKKVMMPFRRSKIDKMAVTDLGVFVSVACVAFRISESCKTISMPQALNRGCANS
jgi:hypothetical protein